MTSSRKPPPPDAWRDPNFTCEGMKVKDLLPIVKDLLDNLDLKLWEEEAKGGR